MKNTKDDRRSKRTRQLLGNALVELMLEKRYDAITVQDILDRANIGRSTFYAHYTDKEDLLLSEITSMIHQMEKYTMEMGHGNSGLLPSLELFRHVKEQRRLMQAFIWGRGDEFFVHSPDFQARITQLIEQKLRAFTGEHTAFSVPPTIVARFIASTFLLLLRWWFEHDMRASPEQMDEMFRKLVIPAIHELTE